MEGNRNRNELLKFHEIRQDIYPALFILLENYIKKLEC